MIDGSACLEQVVKLLYTVLFSKRGVVVLTIVSGALLFLPESILIRFGISGFVQSYRPFIGLVFLVLLTVCVVFIAGKIGVWIKEQLKELALEQKQWEELKHMNELPFALVTQLLMSEDRRLSLPQDAGVVQYLVDYEFIKPLHHFSRAYRSEKLCLISYGPSKWLLRAYQSGEFQEILAERQARFDKEKERTPGTTAT